MGIARDEEFRRFKYQQYLVAEERLFRTAAAYALTEGKHAFDKCDTVFAFEACASQSSDGCLILARCSAEAGTEFVLLIETRKRSDWLIRRSMEVAIRSEYGQEFVERLYALIEKPRDLLPECASRTESFPAMTARLLGKQVVGPAPGVNKYRS